MAVDIQGAMTLFGIVIGAMGTLLGLVARMNYKKLEEAVAQIEEAMSPDSIGGEEVTPTEAIRIFGTIAEVLKNVRR